MALITADNLKKLDKQRNSVHAPVDATYSSFEKNGKKYFQIDTYGSDERKLTQKTSQVIQFDADTAGSLMEIMKNELFD